jgi:hypothetical protein
MNERVSLVEGDGVTAVTSLDQRETLGRFGESLVPRDLLPGVSVAPEGPTQTVRVFLNVLEPERLWAKVPTAQKVFRIASYLPDMAFGHFDGEAAHGLAQVAGSRKKRHTPPSFAVSMDVGAP